MGFDQIKVLWFNLRMELPRLIIETERKIRECESHFPPIGISLNEWVMWISKESFPSIGSKVELRQIVTEYDWQKMLQLRIEIEKNFNIFDETLVSGFVNDIREKVKKLNGAWYLAYANSELVGEIGLIPFKFENKIIGRLQDVDIAPSKQGLGHGHEMLAAIVQLSRDMNLDGLCLLARSEGWVKDWYARFGFNKVGEINRAELTI